MAVRLSTSPYHGYAVQFSPFNGSTLALVGAQNYGIAGHPSLSVVCCPHNVCIPMDLQ